MREPTHFASLLKRYRQAAGLSQEALAARAQLSARAISDLERGINRAPRHDTLELLRHSLCPHINVHCSRLPHDRRAWLHLLMLLQCCSLFPLPRSLGVSKISCMRTPVFVATTHVC